MEEVGKIAPGRLNYRTENRWVDTVIPLDKGTLPCYPIQTIANLLKDPAYASIRWRYYSCNDNNEFHGIPRTLPLTSVFDYAFDLMEPVYCGFTETSEEEEFNRVSCDFYYHLFIQGEIYVSYNIQNYVDIYFKKGEEDQQRTWEIIKEEGGFQIWVKLNPNKYNKDDMEFMHLESSLVIKIPNWRQCMARARWNKQGKSQLPKWVNMSVMEMLATYMLEQCVRLCGKKIKISTHTFTQEYLDYFNDQMKSINSYLHTNLSNINDFEPIQLMDGSDLVAIKETIFYYIDRIKFEYGRVANTNPKGERLTSGENYKDISAIANRQKQTLENLNDFANQVRRMFGVHLEFAVSGIPEKEAIYTMSHEAQTPNTGRTTMGQIEGTQPRTPAGIPTKKSNRPISWKG